MNSPTPEQISDAAAVLAKVKAHDPSAPNPDAAVALAWAEAFAVHGLKRDDLLAGVRVLYSDTERQRDRVLAVDVIKRARQIRRERAERDDQAARARRESIIDAKAENHPVPSIE